MNAAYEISADLRKDRELSFYGDIDFIPTMHYSKEDARRALADAQRAVSVATQQSEGSSPVSYGLPIPWSMGSMVS